MRAKKSFESARHLFVFLTAAYLLSAATATPPLPLGSLNTNLQGRTYRHDRVLVKLKSETISKLGRSELSFHAGYKVQKMIGDYAVLQLDPTRETVGQAIERLEKSGEVESVQPDFIYRKSAVPNDPSFGKLWGLQNSGQTLSKDHLTQSLYTTSNPGTSGRDMGLETAWNRTTDCSSVVVAVIDTGIKLDHDDLIDNLWTNSSNQHGYDFVNNDADPTDDEGHGTHVAGTIGARGNNAVGTTGICWRVQLMGVKVLDENGSGSTSGIIAGIGFAVANGAHIVNMSLGGAGFDSAFQTAVNNASNAGTLLVVAAGNDGANNTSSPTYPCNFPAANLICVGAVDQNFAIASFSNYSTTYVDIGAPGTNIVSGALNTWSTSADLSLASGAWTSNNANFGFTSGYLQNPANWNGTTNLYANNANDQIYTSVDMSGTVGGVALITIRGAAEYGFDFLNVYERATAGNPITGGTQIAELTGTTNSALVGGLATMTVCAGSATCSLGFNFVSDGTSGGIGYRIEKIQIDQKIAATDGLDGLNGTSMATPHVAGLAALVKANNPSFTATDLREAILNTGTRMTALTSRFARGSVANAPGALNYVDPPTGISAAVAP